MRNTFPLALIFFFVVSVGCKTKKNATTSSAISEMQIMEVAQRKFPSIKEQEFQEGKSILANRCTDCHGIKKVESRSEEEWLKIVDRMAPKAKLSALEKTALTRYILSYREAKGNKN